MESGEGKNKIGVIIIIAILIVMLIVFSLAFVYMFNLLSKSNNQTQQVSATVEEINLADETKYPIETDITCNLLPDSEDSKSHIVIVKVTLGMNKKSKEYKKLKLETLIPENEAVIKDAINTILMNKTYSEMRKPNAKTIIASEILETLQNLFGTNAITNVYLEKFNYQ